MREQGTVAIIVALSTTMLFALCALGVDLGAGFARKRDIQTQADLASLAAAAKLPHNATSDPAIYAAATTNASSNRVSGQVTSSWNFSDSNTSNGYIVFVGKNKLRLFAPISRVEFMLAPAVGLPNHMNVSAVAAAEIRSPGSALPFFVSQTCGWQMQTILDQTAGPTIPPTYVPVLVPPSVPASGIKIEPPITPTSAVLNASSVSMTITTTTGSGFNNIDKVGFTPEGAGHQEIAGVSVTGKSGVFSVPSAVLNSEKIWWVRLHEKATRREPLGSWTAADNAQPFIVGDPASASTPVCDTKNKGNFGSLDLSRDDVVTSKYLVQNMALGVQHSFDYYPKPYPPPAPCAGQAQAVMDKSPNQPVAGRMLNCLTTDTGSDLAQKATDAFISGTASGSPARLSATGHPTASGCGTDREMTAMPGKPKINNDVLSCFITNPAVTVGDVGAKNLNPLYKNVISNAIFDSPRFFWIPVLASDPSGGSGSYAIVDFRPVFITGQEDGAWSGDPKAATNADNGIIMAGNGKMIEKIKVRAINPLALQDFSPDEGDQTIDYVGTGTKIVRLVE